MKTKQGFAPIIILVAVLVVGALAGGGVYVKNKIDDKKDESQQSANGRQTGEKFVQNDEGKKRAESDMIQTQTKSVSGTSGNVQPKKSAQNTTADSDYPVGAASTVPAYPNNEGPAPLPESMKKMFYAGLAIPEDATIDMFGTSDTSANVISWYRKNLKGWVLWKQAVFSPESNPKAQTLALVYRGGNQGLCVLAVEKMFPQVMVVTVRDSWAKIDGCGKITRLVFEDETPPEGAEDAPESIAGIYTGPSVGGSSHDNTPTVNVDVDWTVAKVVADPTGDFWMGGGSPPQLIKYGPSDLLKVNFTNDSEYLYVKFFVADAIPTLPLVYAASYGSDTVRIIPFDCVLDTDLNKSTGNIMNMEGGDAAIETWFGSPEEANGKFYKYAKYAFYDPSGEENVGDWANGAFIGGGVGSTYVSARYPLAALKLKSGSVFDARCIVEAESDAYHHFARDVMPTDSSWITGISVK